MSTFRFTSVSDEADIKVMNLQTSRRYLYKELFVEDIGVEPMTPSLQS
jgi:hypothetical protein